MRSLSSLGAVTAALLLVLELVLAVKYWRKWSLLLELSREIIYSDKEMDKKLRKSLEEGNVKLLSCA